MAAPKGALWASLAGASGVIVYVLHVTGCGRAREEYKVEAPATTGHPLFERAYRVQMNSLEQSVIFLPALYMSSRFFHWKFATALGFGWSISRLFFGRAYMSDPKKRGPAFIAGFAMNMALLLSGVAGVVYQLATGKQIPVPLLT